MASDRYELIGSFVAIKVVEGLEELRSDQDGVVNGNGEYFIIYIYIHQFVWM
jgi:hypothetical protein